MGNRQRILTTFLLCSLASVAFAGDGEIRKRNGAIRERYIVVLEDSVERHGVRGAAAALAAEHGATIQTVWTSALKGFAVVMPEGRARAMSRDPRVRFIEEDAEISISAAIPTNFDPSQACDPAVQQCPTTPENRLWHLDRLEQNSAALNNRYGYCTTGAGVYIYVVDTGVMAQHSEFWASETDQSHPRVLSGYSAVARVPRYPNAPDTAPADNPCNGWGTTSSQIYVGGHGTSVASVAAGRKVGFAKGATIVPVKVIECRSPWRGTIGQLIEGVDWIVRVRGEEPDPNDGNPEAYRDTDGKVRLLHPSVATFSTFKRIADELPEAISDLELALDALDDANVTVIASANNQNADACTTTPARHSRGNPDASLSGKVITVGGTQILNSPMGLPVGNGVYDPSRPAADGRWICDPAVDDSVCSLNQGSNFGPCVTMFAPARNITSASMAGERTYRTGMGDGLGEKTHSSGTSFSAPIVAAATARILEQLPQYETPESIYEHFIVNGWNVSRDLLNPDDPETLGEGSPNIMLRFGDVKVTVDPVPTGVDSNDQATLSVTATTGIPPLHYQWFRITNPSYVPDGAPPLGWPVATPIGTDSPIIIVTPSTRTSYFVRVTNDCCETDSNAATVYPRPGIPLNASAGASVFGTSVTVAWTPADNKAEGFHIFQQANVSPGFSKIGSTNTNSFSTPVSPNTAYVYRVQACAGVSTVQPACSNFSNRDLAVTVPWTDSPIDSTVRIKAVHIDEMRTAVNALSDHLNLSRPYDGTSLLNQLIYAWHWSTLQTQINSLRTNSGIGVPAFPFSEVPAPNVPIRKLHIDELRNSVK